MTKIQLKRIFNKIFPSPFGVQFFLMENMGRYEIKLLLFPSPFGVQFFLICTFSFRRYMFIGLFPSPFGVQFFLIQRT